MHMGAYHVADSMVESLLADAEEEFETAERRLEKRIAGYAAVLRSDDYVFVRCCVPPSSLILVGPDPINLTVSKRQWERSMQGWRRALSVFRLRSVSEVVQLDIRTS